MSYRESSLKQIGIRMLRDNKERILRLIDEVHVIDRELTELWAEKGLCEGVGGTLEIDVDSVLLERRGRKWVEVDESTSPSAGWLELVLFIEELRHNPMRLLVNWWRLLRKRKLFELDVLNYDDYLHLESREDVPEIKKQVSRRIEKFLGESG